MQKVFACIDGSQIGSAVIDAAIWAAKRTAEPLQFVHALALPLPQGADDLTAIIGLGSQTALIEQLAKLEQERNEVAKKHAHLLLQAAYDKAHAAQCEQLTPLQVENDLVDALLELEPQSRLMILGRCGKGHGENFKVLGSHIETILRQVTTPVVIVPAQFHQPTNFMLAYDGSESSDKAIAQIIKGGILKGLTCHLVMVDKHDNQSKQQLEQAQQLLQDHGFDVIASLLDGDVYNALWQYKSDKAIDALVMGAFGHSRLRQFFLGSTTLKMIEDCHIPLVIMK